MSAQQPLVFVRDSEAVTREELFVEMAQALGEVGAVAPTFLPALTDREEQFPTGLDFGQFAVAIPHIDAEHVCTPGLVVCRLATAVTFRAMDRHDHGLLVRLTIWPLVIDPEQQVGLLGACLRLLQVPGNYELLQDGDAAEVAVLLRGALDTTYAPH